MTAAEAIASDFTLPDHRGGTFHLMEHLAPAGLVLVFYRGHWCPYCRRYLTKLQSNWPRFAERGVSLAAISPEPLSTSIALARDLSIEFPLLSDAAGSVIDRYSVRNGFSSVRMLLPHPAVFALNGEGQIRLRSIDRNFKKRTPIRAIFRALDTLTAG